MKTLAVLLAAAVVMSPANVKTVIKKRVALTFDDGPHPKYTRKILDILERYEVKGTFFVIGANAERYPELVKAEYDAGHEIGNHTYSHKKISECSCKEIIKEIKKTDDIVYNITGEYPALFRPPEGKTTKDLEACVSAENKQTVLWTVDTRDWAHNSTENIVKNIIKNAKDGSVILFHDYISGGSPTLAALEIIIPYLKDNGYELVTVSELTDNN